MRFVKGLRKVIKVIGILDSLIEQFELEMRLAQASKEWSK
jgi:hypothetical protein